MSQTEAYSGVVVEQNQRPEDVADSVALSNSYYYQTFYLPKDYTRGIESETNIPPLTGLQLFVGIDSGYAHTATLEWRVDHYIEGVGWTNLVLGTAIGAPLDGSEVWFSIFFENPVDLNVAWLTDQFRVGVKGRSASNSIIGQEVDDYDGSTVTINGQTVVVRPDIAPGGLQEGVRYPFEFNGVPSFLYLEPGSGIVSYSIQQGVNRLWYSVPNPLALTFSRAYQSNGTTPVQDSSRDVSLLFKVLAGVADSGTDFLGNLYRSTWIRNKVESVTTALGNDRDTFWLSAPQPSKFAVVSQYYDMRDEGGAAAVIDSILIDPITPGPYFHVYYSNDEEPGTDIDSWDQLLWTPIPQAFHLTGRKTYVLPKPITAKYIKIEYSHLQAKHYAPGEFQKPVVYRKHPKWVLDYFLARILARNTEDPFIGREIEVTYDALRFAYQYVTDDQGGPDGPPLSEEQFDVLRQEDANTVIDNETLNRIRLIFQPYANEPALLGRNDYLLGSYLNGVVPGDYPVEQVADTQALIDEVSSLDREPVILEKSYPVMFFYVTSRHGYREAAVRFDRDRAYYIGINEIAFLRDRYDAITDSSLYIESAGDLVNVERNDFETVDFSWVTYRD